ncbi:MAG: sigma-54-dependent Fis family transcriptional regulator [Anaerolineae bacterium]|nr:sigma-54-dependent Fis family transcriptional regulator [Anaerolineae bacterium]
MPASILVVDDEVTLRYFLERSLRDQGYETLSAGTVADALDLVYTRQIDCALLDQHLPDGVGFDVLRALKEVDADLPIIVLTGYGSLDSVKTAFRYGVFDYLTKPPDLVELKRLVGQALQSVDMRRAVRRHQAAPSPPSADLVMGRNRTMREIVRLVQRVAVQSTNVLIQGESGTGKDVVANLVHRLSPRAERKFVAINCAAIPDHLLESELFGYEAGAFTGARRQKKGLIEEADKGTLFLDEIGAMRPDLQAKLLRVLESREFRRLGGTTDIRVDVRLVSATNRDLQAAVAAGEFREDLYWRLSVIPIHLPPLRERLEDIDLLIAKFISEFARLFGKEIHGVAPEALQALHSHHWPGNIRELRNVIERAAILCDGPELTTAHLPSDLMTSPPRPQVVGRSDSPQLPPTGLDLKSVVADLELDLIHQALERAGGNQTLAAQLLHISRDELRYRLKKYNKAQSEP